MSDDGSASISTVDDQDSQVSYQGQWQHETNLSPSFQAQDNTASFPSSAGATVTYTFRREVIIAICLPLFSSPNDTLSANFTLDGSPQPPYTASFKDNATTVECYSSPGLSTAGDHTFVVQFGHSGSSLFGLDTFALANSTDSASGTGNGNGNAPLRASTVPVGAIVGGVIGGVALLVAVLLALYFLWWRRRSRKPYFFSHATPEDMLTHEEKISPFVSTLSPGLPSEHMPPYPGPPSDLSASRPVTMYAGSIGISLANTAAGTAVYSPTSLSHGSGAPESSFGGSQATTNYRVTNAPEDVATGSSSLGVPQLQQMTWGQRKAAEAGIRTTPQELQQHADSGFRFGESSSAGAVLLADGPAEVPPAYTQS